LSIQAAIWIEGGLRPLLVLGQHSSIQREEHYEAIVDTRSYLINTFNPLEG
jgi:hypothetical protein